MIDLIKEKSKLESKLEPILKRLGRSESLLDSYRLKSNQKLTNYINDNCKLSESSNISVYLSDYLTKIMVNNKEISIKSINYDYLDLDSFDYKYSISTYSNNCDINDTDGLDVNILVGFLSQEMKSGEFFNNLKSLHLIYFKHLKQIMDIKKETYPIYKSIKDIDKEILNIEKQKIKDNILLEIKDNIGKLYKPKDPNHRLTTILNLTGFTSDKLKVVKINRKNIVIDFVYNESSKFTRSINKNLFISKFNLLERYYTESEKLLMNRSKIINKLLNVS